MIAFEFIDWLFLALFIAAALGLTFGPYVFARSFLYRRASARTSELAGSVLFRIGSLHALILALMFAHVTSSFLDLRNAVAEEAAATTEVYFDLQRYDPGLSDIIRRDLALYANAVVNEEWGLLDDQQLSGEAWEQWRKVFNAVLDLEPENLRQEDLRQFMLKNMEEIARLRQLRHIGAQGNIPPLFWVVAIAGFALISLPYFVFEPSPTNMLLLFIFATYNGLVLYVIYATGHPFDSPIFVEPTPFRTVFGNP